jgi:hypothetical protein
MHKPRSLNELVSISVEDPDYYQWGANCGMLGKTRNAAAKVAAKFTREQLVLFWQGYEAAYRPRGTFKPISKPVRVHHPLYHWLQQ